MGDPQTRPVVGAISGPTVRSGDLLSRILDAVSLSRETQTEALSSEEILAGVEEIQTAVRNGSRRSVARSIDVTALYPSLRVKEAEKMVGQAVNQKLDQIPGCQHMNSPDFLGHSP